MAILTKNQLSASNASSFPDNTAGLITPEILRDFNTSIIDTLVDSLNTGSYAITTGSNDFTQPNSFTSISASSFVSASGFVGDGSKLTNITASIALPILDEGILQGYATSMNFTGSAISATIVGGTAVVQVNIDNVGLVTTASFNAYTSSTNTSITNLNASSASQQVSINALNQSSASQQVSINALNVFTASQDSSSIVNSITELNTFSASAKIELVNLNTSVTNLNSFSSSTNSSITQLNASTASQQISINALNTFTASQSTASIVTSINNLNTFSASALVSISNLNSTTASLNTSVSNLNTATSSLFTSASLALVTASFDTGTRNLTFTKGNGTTFGVNIPDVSGSTINTGSFVTTSSFNDYTASQSTASLVTSINNLNTFTQSAQVSINALNSATSSYVTEAESGSFLITASVNLNTITFTKGNNTTFAVTVDTGSATTTDLTSLNAFTQSQYVSNSFFATTGSNTFVGNQTITGNISAFSASFTYLQTIFESSSVIYSSGSNIFGDELSDTQTLSGSVKVQGSLTVNGTPVQTSSVDISALNSATASLFTSASLALTTASFDNGTRNLTFTKGDNQTFSVNIPDVSGSTLPSGVISGSAQITSLGFVSSSVTASSLVTASFAGNTLTFTKGDASTFGIVIPDNSGSAGDFVTTSSFNAYTSSNDQKVNSLVSATGSYATTGSNVFVGNQTVTGSLFISGNINMVNGADIVTHHVKAAGSNGLELQTSAGTIIVAMGQGGGTQAGFVGAVTANSISASTINGLGDPLAFSTSVDSRLDGLEASTASLFTSASLSLTTASFAGNTLTFRKGDGTTFGVVIPDVSGSTINTGSFATTGSNAFFGTNTFSGAVAFTGSAPTILSSSFSGSIITNLTDIYTDVSAVQQIVTLTSASYAALASGSLTNPNTLYIVSGSISGSSAATVSTASLMVTGSVTGNVLTFTKGDATTFTLTVATGSGGGAAFPYTGDAVITGSLQVTGSFRGFVSALTVASSTASIDMVNGNFFTLNLPTSSTTHISVTNIKPGQTINLQVSQSSANTGSVAFAPNIKFAGGFDYTATAITGALDLLSFVAFDANQILATSVKNLL